MPFTVCGAVAVLASQNMRDVVRLFRQLSNRPPWGPQTSGRVITSLPSMQKLVLHQTASRMNVMFVPDYDTGAAMGKAVAVSPRKSSCPAAPSMETPVLAAVSEADPDAGPGAGAAATARDGDSDVAVAAAHRSRDESGGGGTAVAADGNGDDKRERDGGVRDLSSNSESDGGDDTSSEASGYEAKAAEEEEEEDDVTRAELVRQRRDNRAVSTSSAFSGRGGVSRKLSAGGIGSRHGDDKDESDDVTPVVFPDEESSDGAAAGQLLTASSTSGATSDAAGDGPAVVDGHAAVKHATTVLPPPLPLPRQRKSSADGGRAGRRASIDEWEVLDMSRSLVGAPSGFATDCQMVSARGCCSFSSSCFHLCCASVCRATAVVPCSMHWSSPCTVAVMVPCCLLSRCFHCAWSRVVSSSAPRRSCFSPSDWVTRSPL